MYEKWLEILKKCELFKNMHINELNAMLECLKPRIINYKKNEFITISGNAPTSVCIVLSGSVAVIKETSSGHQTLINTLYPGDIFGEVAAFSSKKLFPASVLSQERCSIMFLPSDKITVRCPNMCFNHEMLIRNMLKIVSDKALILNRKVEYLTMNNLRKKISSFIIEQYKSSGKLTFILPFNRNELANFFNVSRPSLSREMCKMRDEGLIDFHKSVIKILDMKALVDSVE